MAATANTQRDRWESLLLYCNGRMGRESGWKWKYLSWSSAALILFYAELRCSVIENDSQCSTVNVRFSGESEKSLRKKTDILLSTPNTCPHNPSRVEYQQRIKTRKQLDRVNSIHPSRPECLKSAVRKWFTNGNKLPAHISHSNGFIRLLFQWVRIEYFCLTSV